MNRVQKAAIQQILAGVDLSALSDEALGELHASTIEDLASSAARFTLRKTTELARLQGAALQGGDLRVSFVVLPTKDNGTYRIKLEQNLSAGFGELRVDHVVRDVAPFNPVLSFVKGKGVAGIDPWAPETWASLQEFSKALKASLRVHGIADLPDPQTGHDRLFSADGGAIGAGCRELIARIDGEILSRSLGRLADKLRELSHLHEVVVLGPTGRLDIGGGYFLMRGFRSDFQIATSATSPAEIVMVLNSGPIVSSMSAPGRGIEVRSLGSSKYEVRHDSSRGRLEGDRDVETLRSISTLEDVIANAVRRFAPEEADLPRP